MSLIKLLNNLEQTEIINSNTKIIIHEREHSFTKPLINTYYGDIVELNENLIVELFKVNIEDNVLYATVDMKGDNK